MTLPDAARVTEELPELLRPIFAPMVKVAMGAALGAWFGFSLALYAAVHLLPPLHEQDLFIWLLGNNFLPGYRPGWEGAFLGLLWGAGLGFCAGYFLAGLRNLAITLWIAIVGANAQFKEDADHILDEI